MSLINRKFCYRADREHWDTFRNFGGEWRRPGVPPARWGIAQERKLRALSLGAAACAFGLSHFGPYLALYLHDVLLLVFPLVRVMRSCLGVDTAPFSMAGGLRCDEHGRRPVLLGTLVGGVTAFAILVRSRSKISPAEYLISASTARASRVSGAATSGSTPPTFPRGTPAGRVP